MSAGTFIAVLPLAVVEAPPSLKDGITRYTERLYRLFGTGLIAEMCVLLRLPQVVAATAQALFHRLYYRKSFAQFDAHVVAMTAVFLGAKVEEEPRRIRDVINVCYRLKLRRQRKVARPITLGGHLYTLWKAEVLQAERYMLKDLGFAMYSLNDHPHRFVLYYVRALGGDEALAQAAWAFLNDSMRLDLCVRYPPESIACAALYLAARVTGFPLPTAVPWSEVFATSEQTLLVIAEEIASLYPVPTAGAVGAGGAGGSDAQAPPRRKRFADAAPAAGPSDATTSSQSGSAAVPVLGPLRVSPSAAVGWLPSLRPNAVAGEDDEAGEAFEPLPVLAPLPYSAPPSTA